MSISLTALPALPAIKPNARPRRAYRRGALDRDGALARSQRRQRLALVPAPAAAPVAGPVRLSVVEQPGRSWSITAMPRGVPAAARD